MVGMFIVHFHYHPHLLSNLQIWHFLEFKTHLIQFCTWPSFIFVEMSEFLWEGKWCVFNLLGTTKGWLETVPPDRFWITILLLFFKFLVNDFKIVYLGDASRASKGNPFVQSNSSRHNILRDNALFSLSFSGIVINLFNSPKVIKLVRLILNIHWTFKLKYEGSISNTYFSIFCLLSLTNPSSQERGIVSNPWSPINGKSTPSNCWVFT